jgi:DNA-binding NarL/FixJ family response regulator
VLLDSLAHYLARHEQFAIVGQLTHGDQCVGCVEKYRPDVVVMDVSMPGMGVFERLKALQSQALTAPAVLILTSELGSTSLSELISAGARGYLPKDSDGKQLIAAIMALSMGNIYLHSDSTNMLQHRPPAAAVSDLSAREHQLLTLMAQGCSNKEIAAKLFLSTGTIKSYSSRLFEKLNVHGRTQAVLHAMRNGTVYPATSDRPRPA